MNEREDSLDAWIGRRGGAPSPSLADLLAAVPGPIFAAIDGAQFDDVAGLLKSANIPARSLFLGVADAESEAAGPWLANVDTAAAIDRFLALLGDKPAAVFWSCPAGEAALYRHLRLLNEAIVPLSREDAPERAEGEARPASDFKDTRVLFRHWDPRVLAQVLPVLDEAQFARVLGPATLAVMPREDGGEPYQAPALENAVIAPQGPLRLTVEQFEEISKVRVESSRRRIVAYVRNVAPIECELLGEKRIHEIVRESEVTGKSMGLTTEQGFGRWTYVMVKTDGSALRQPGLREYVTDARTSPDEKMYWLLKSMAVMQRRTGASW